MLRSREIHFPALFLDAISRLSRCPPQTKNPQGIPPSGASVSVSLVGATGRSPLRCLVQFQRRTTSFLTWVVALCPLMPLTVTTYR